MILMIDDVKMVNADMFYPYVSKALAHDTDSIANGDKLYEKLCEVEEPLEIMIHDFDDIPEESLEFAKGVLSVFMDARMKNKNITVNFINDGSNLNILDNVMEKTGCKILLAQKAFSMYSTYPMISQHLKGTTASGLYEAKLGREEFDGEVHVYSPAYTEKDMNELVQICDHIVFNSPKQWQKFKGIVEKSDRKISCGIRCNPEYSEIETDIYNPCFKNSRLGTTLDNFDDSLIDGIEGLHFHTMCEQGADVLKRTIPHIEEKFGKYLYNMKWINLGGGHHITRDDYDLDTLIECVNYFHDKYGVQVYLEPGEAVALNAGYLVSEVIDTAKNGMDLAILDASAACHMPDVLEMPYRPNVRPVLQVT